MPNLFKRLFEAQDRGDFLRRYYHRKRWRMRSLLEKLASPRERSLDYVIRTRLGLRLILDPTSLVDQEILKNGTWEPKQIEMMARAFRWANTQKTPMFFDVGSYWGLYALLAAKAKMKNTHAFEADPKNHSQLRSQIFLNNLVHHIQVHHTAVSDHTGTLTFLPSEMIADGNRGSTGVMPSDCVDAIPMNCSRLDDLFDVVGATIICKLDVEGHEPAVLRGMARLIAQNRVFLQVEEFEKNRVATSAAAAAAGLRCVHTIEVDRYYTNIPDDELAWLT